MFIRLLFARRFWPHFWAQFLGAFNENVFRNGVIIMITYRSLQFMGLKTDQLVALAGGVSILPFFLFCAFAGEIADKWPKNRLVFLIKGGELIGYCLAVVALLMDSMPLLLTAAIIMGVQSTLFGPVKFSILSELLDPDKLTESNALIGMGTFVAILLGTLLGGFLGAHDWQGMLGICVVMMVVALLGVFCAWLSPHTPARVPQLKISYGVIGPVISMLKITAQDRMIQKAVWSVAWFWFIGATLMGMLPIYVKESLGEKQAVATGFLVLFTIGVAMGTLIGGKFAKKFSQLIPLSLLIAGLTGVDLWIQGSYLGGVHLRTILDLFLMSLCGGIYIVPLQTFVQSHGEPEERSRTVAGSMFYNSLGMLLSAGMMMLIYSIGGHPPEIFLLLGLGSTAISVWLFTSRIQFK